MSGFKEQIIQWTETAADVSEKCSTIVARSGASVINTLSPLMVQWERSKLRREDVFRDGIAEWITKLQEAGLGAPEAKHLASLEIQHRHRARDQEGTIERLVADLLTQIIGIGLASLPANLPGIGGEGEDQ